MDISPIALKIVADSASAVASMKDSAQAADNVTKSFDRARDAKGRFVKATDDATAATGRARDALGRFVKTTDDVKKSTDDAAKATDDLDTSLTKLGGSSGAGSGAFDTLKSKVTSFGASLRQAKKDNQDLIAGLQSLRTTGMALTGAGVVLMAGTSKAREVSNDDLGDKQRISDLAQDQGRGGDTGAINNAVDDIAERGHLADKKGLRSSAVSMMSDEVATKDLNPLLEAATRNSQTLKKGIDEIGESFSKAYGELSLTRLKRQNILFQDGAQEAIDQAASISKVAGQQEFMRQVMMATERDTVKLGQGMTEAQKAANDLSRSGREAMDALGSGAAEAKREQDGLTTSILKTLNVAPGFLQATGYVGQFGGEIAAAAGGVLTLGSQAGMTLLSLQSMGVTGAGAINLIRTTALAALPTLALLGSVAAGIAIGKYAYDHGVGENIQRVLQRDAYEKKVAGLNKVLGDPNASKDKKVQMIEEGIRDFNEAGFNSDVADLQKQHKQLTGEEYDIPDPVQEKIEAKQKKMQDDFMAQMKSIQPASSSSALTSTASNSGNVSSNDFEASGEDYKSEIRQLEHKKDGEGKGARKIDNERIRNLREAMQDQHAAESAANKAAREEDREADAERMGGAKTRAEIEKESAESVIQKLHAASVARARLEQDAETAAERQYEDSHKRALDGSLTSLQSVKALLSKGFDLYQIKNAERVEKAAQEAARANSDVDETAKTRHLEDMRTAFHRRREDEEAQEREAEGGVRSGSRSAAAAIIADAEGQSSNPLTRIKGRAGEVIAGLREHVDNFAQSIVPNTGGNLAYAGAGGSQNLNIRANAPQATRQGRKLIIRITVPDMEVELNDDYQRDTLGISGGLT